MLGADDLVQLGVRQMPEPAPGGDSDTQGRPESVAGTAEAAGLGGGDLAFQEDMFSTFEATAHGRQLQGIDARVRLLHDEESELHRRLVVRACFLCVCRFHRVYVIAGLGMA